MASLKGTSGYSRRKLRAYAGYAVSLAICAFLLMCGMTGLGLLIMVGVRALKGG